MCGEGVSKPLVHSSKKERIQRNLEIILAKTTTFAQVLEALSVYRAGAPESGEYREWAAALHAWLGTRFSPLTVDVVEARAEGLSLRRTAERLGISHAWAQRILLRVSDALGGKEPGGRIEFVYFALCKKTATLKIGRAKDPQKRLGELQVGHPFKVELLGTIPGGRVEERRLHEEFAVHRLSGEWFRANDEVLSAVLRIMHTQRV